jgi:hypothetical protein
MGRELGHVAGALGIAAALCVHLAGSAHARTGGHEDAAAARDAPSAASGASRDAKPRETLFSMDDALPWDGYLKVGRFAPAWSVEEDEDWVSAPSAAELAEWQASPERTFVAAEAGRKTIGLGARMSAAGQSKSGELDLRLAATAYRRWNALGPASNVVASASAATSEAGGRRAYAYTGASGFSLGPLSFVGRGAVVERLSPNGPKRSWSAHAQARWLVAGWFDTRLAFERFDPDHRRHGDERNRISIGVEPSFERHVRARVCYRVIDGPRNRRANGADELAFEVHVSF